MKKLFALLALCLATMTIQAAVPAKIQQFMDEFNAEVKGKTEDGVTFGDAKIEGNALVLYIYIDDSELAEYGLNLNDAFEIAGGTEVYEALFWEEIFADADAEDKAIFEEFKQSKLDMVFRMIGSASEVAVDLRIRYQDMNN